MAGQTLTTQDETIDHTELRKLAEAATPGPWIADTFLITQGKAYSEDMRALQISHLGIHGERRFSPEQGVQNAAFIAAANPAQVIALLDEIDHLRQCWLESADAEQAASGLLIMRDAELAQLRADLEQCKSLLRRSSNHIQSWWKQYGSEGLPPANGVQLVEDIDAALSTETEEKKS